MRAALSPLLLLSCAPHPRGAAPLPQDPAACFAQLAGALSEDALQGRGVGSAGLEQASALLQGTMRGLGLQRPPGGFTQPFEVTTGLSLGPDNRLSVGEALAPEQFTPLGFSASGAFEGELAFVGYGLQSAPHGYDDYEGIDVRGKVVLALRYEPSADDPNSPFDGRRPVPASDLRYKAMRARLAGAAALVLVTGPGSVQPGDLDTLPPLRVSGPTSDAGIPVLQVTRAVAEAWVGASGASLAELQAQIDQSGRPASRPLPGQWVRGQVDLRPTRAPAHNVLGYWPGEGALAEELVVVGAHYDHLGLGGAGSMRPDVEAVHNGADDNASGVAAMLCGVGALRAAPPEGPRRGLLVVGFSAEEVGLAGSAWYVDHPVYPLEQTVAMVNLDMVGRVREGRIQALGSDTAPEWAGWLGAAGQQAGLAVGLGGDGYGPSDHMSFYTKKIPVVHLFSGSHPEYHTPEDDAALLNTAGGGQVAVLLGGLLGQVLTAPQGPTLQESPSAPPMAGDSRSSGAWLGTIPDYSAMEATEGGVLLAGVRAGGPADLAGLQAGDRLVALGGVEIRNLYDMTFVLQDHRPGDTLEVVVERGGERRTLHATLGRRGADPAGPHAAPWSPKAGTDASALLRPEERHLRGLRQLTDGGENAEAYWSPDGRSLIFQRTPAEGGCDQQFTLNLDTGAVEQVSSGLGRTTCGYYAWPRGDAMIWATTEGASPECPPPPDRSQGYVWPLYAGYDLVWRRADGTQEPFLPSPGYDAEATVCMRDGRVLFTSVRDGDLELYVAGADGRDLRRLTSTPGYDGGAFFTPDCEHIVWRASRPEGKDLEDYRALLAQGLVRPGRLEVYRMKSDGTEVVQLTRSGAASFGPYPAPDGRVIFSSNAGGSPREFDLWLVDDQGALEQVTWSEGFDGFPMFSPDGRWLVFASNRGGEGGETNLFVAEWVP